MSGTAVVYVDSREALERVCEFRFLARVFLPRVVLSGPAVDAGTTGELQARVDRLADACGCGEGAAATLLALGAFLTHAVAAGTGYGVAGLVARGLLAVLAGATIGKFIGLLRARLELRGVLRELTAVFPQTDPARRVAGQPEAALVPHRTSAGTER